MLSPPKQDIYAFCGIADHRLVCTCRSSLTWAITYHQRESCSERLSAEDSRWPPREGQCLAQQLGPKVLFSVLIQILTFEEYARSHWTFVSIPFGLFLMLINCQALCH